MVSKVETLISTVRRGVASERVTFGADLFSVVAGVVARAVGVVTVLSLASESIGGGLVALVAFGLYVSVGNDELYRQVNRRFHLEPGSDFALRTVGYPAGAFVLVGVFTILGAIDPTGTFAGATLANGSPIGALLTVIGSLPVGVVLLATGGLLVVEASGMVVRRLTLSRADAYVGVSEPSGLVALTGTVVDIEDRDVGQSTGEASEPTHQNRTANASGRRTTSTPQSDRTAKATEPKRVENAPASHVREDRSGRDGAVVTQPTREGSEDVPADDPDGPTFIRSDDESATGRTDPGSGENRQPQSNANAVDDPATFDDEDDDGRLMTDGGRPVADGGRPVGSGPDAEEPDAGTGERELLALAAYDPDEPVIVERETGNVVATRKECHPDRWISTIVKYLVKSFYHEHGVDLRDDRETLHRLRIVAKRVREDLEERTETEVLLPFIADVPGDGAVHIRRTFSVVQPDNGSALRPPFSTVVVADPNADPGSESDADSGDAEPAERPATDDEPAGTDAKADDSDDEPAGTNAEADDAVDPTPATGQDRSVRASPPREEPSPASGSGPTEPTTVDAGSAQSDATEQAQPARGEPQQDRAAESVSRQPRTAPSEPEQTPVDVESGSSTSTTDDSTEADDPVETDHGLADEPVVDLDTPESELLSAPASGEDCVAYAHRERDNTARTVDVGPVELTLTGRRLDAFDADHVPFDLESFGTRIHVDPDEKPTVMMNMEDVSEDETAFVYESTMEPDDTITVVGRLEASDEPGVDYEIRDGGRGGVVFSNLGADTLAHRLSSGAALRVVAAGPLLVGGAMATPFVDAGLVASVGILGVLFGGTAAVGYFLKGKLSGGTLSRLGNRLTSLVDRGD